MAQLFPNQLPALRQDKGLYRELDVLKQLEAGLPAGYDIFHSVALHRVENTYDRYGEIDIVVLDPAGRLLLIEVKAGGVELCDGQLYKQYQDGLSNIGQQCQLQYAAMKNALKAAGLSTYVVNCLVLPDYVLEGGHAVSMPRERIIDATRFSELASTITTFLAGGDASDDRPALHRFLNNAFDVRIDLGSLAGQLRNTVRQLSDGLATWVPRIHAPSGLIRLQASAGSGKTQLALQLLATSAAEGRKAAYVCYNRPLADHIRKLAPATSEVATFHELCTEHYKRKHGEPDFSDPSVFATMEAAYLKDSADFAARLDLLIVDEGQDFNGAWIQSCCARLRGDGKLYLMEDDNQRVYDREPFELADAVTVSCNDNYRSPRAICQMINALGLAATPVVSKNPYHGAVPGFRVYDSERALRAQTVAAIDALREQGHALADIVVLSARGRANSVLLQSTQLGRYSVGGFTGSYTPDGEAIWREADVVVESVYRYKGQSAPAVVLTELDFNELTLAHRRKLFVALSRAQLAVEVVLTGSAEQCLKAELEGTG